MVYLNIVMPKKKAKTKNKAFWFQIGLIGALIAAPNATVIRFSVADADPILFNFLRFGVVALVMTPFILKSLNKFNKKNLMDAIKAGFFMAIAVSTYVWAVKLSQASYVSIILLLLPIVLVVYSAKMNREKITSRSVAGITLAALGAMSIVLLPLALSQGASFSFYPLATVLALIDCAFFPLSIIYYRRANLGGMPMSALMGISSWIVCATSLVMFALFSNHNVSIEPKFLIGLLYSGLVVSLLSRVIGVASYEHIGAAASGGLAYLEVFLGVLIPVIFLHEKLSTGMIIGGILILLGLYVVQHHKKIHHKHHYIFRHH